MTPLQAFLEGALAMGYLVVALSFLRFWRTSHDRLFACFAGAFALMALLRVIQSLLAIPDENRHLIYVLRFAAHSLIIWGIVGKNLASAGGPRSSPPGGEDVGAAGGHVPEEPLRQLGSGEFQVDDAAAPRQLGG